MQRKKQRVMNPSIFAGKELSHLNVWIFHESLLIANSVADLIKSLATDRVISVQVYKDICDFPSTDSINGKILIVSSETFLTQNCCQMCQYFTINQKSIASILVTEARNILIRYPFPTTSLPLNARIHHHKLSLCLAIGEKKSEVIPQNVPYNTLLKLLTSQELKVLNLLANRKTVYQIAARYSMAIKTAYSHKSNIRKKLGISNIQMKHVSSIFPNTCILSGRCEPTKDSDNN